MSPDPTLMPAALDREASSVDRDAFGHRHLALALRSLIESGAHEPPFSIGLLGGWGTGKSTIKEFYVRDLVDDARKEDGRTRSDRIHCITFNAWRFGGKDQDVKRALLRHVFRELGGDEPSLQDRLFRQVSQSLEQPKGFVQYQKELLRAWALPLPALVLVVLLLLAALALALSYLPIQGELVQSSVIIALSWVFAYVLKQVKSPPVAAQHSLARIDLPSTTAEQYEDLLLGQIARFKAGQDATPAGKTGMFCERLVVFVDDLDRLSAEEMVLGLDAVRTFMEIPTSRLPRGLGLVFVISCDEAKVAHALSKGRRQGDLPGTVFSQSDARRFLDRIFQFRLEIPLFPRQDMREYARKKLTELPEIPGDLEERGVALDALVDRMIHVGVHNPRNALQIVNAFAQAWWLARKRETEELGTDKPGGLHERAVTAHPLSLGALSALKVDFPDFYGDLQTDPAFLERITDVIIRKKPLKEQPLHTQQLLRERYLTESQDGDGLVEVRAEHRPLRQFLASLIGLRWPDSLQSLLLLSEDPITRKFGAKAPAIYDAFVSGDTQGLTEALGRHLDAGPLKSEEARLLHQMAEDLRRESPTRRANASRVIADLVDRLPETARQLLLGSLCRELADSSDLRSQLGLEKIAKILAGAHGEDRRSVGSRLVEDVLSPDQEVRLRLETMEPPNLEEAVEFAQRTVDLVLPIRRDHGLDLGADAQLLEWLEERTVRMGGKQYQLPFKDLERWMDAHESHLLPDLSHRYTDLLAADLEGPASSDIDPERAIPRARKVFDQLWAAGEDTRPTLWKQLTRYVALQQPAASRAAWECIAQHVTAPSGAEVSSFLGAFVLRLNRQATEEGWSLDFPKASDAFFEIVRTRLRDLEQESYSAFAELASLWSQDDETASLACELVTEMRPIATDEANKVLAEWAPRVLTDLPIACGRLLAAVVTDLPTEAQVAVAAALQPVIANDAVSEEAGERYRSFMETLPAEAWDIAKLKEHIDKLLPQIAERYTNPNSHLKRVFPPIPKVLSHAAPAVVGQSLHNLFANAKTQPNHYAWLHECMVGSWPRPSSELAPYNPAQIFSDTCDFASKHPNASSRGLLRSLRDMLRTEVVPDTHLSALAVATCSTWTAKREDALDTFKARVVELSSGQIAALCDSVDWNNAEQRAHLAEAWAATTTDRVDLLSTTAAVLKKGAQGSEEEPDAALRLWLDALGAKRGEVLANVMRHPDLEDTHRKRLWLQAARSASDLGPNFFLRVLPELVALPSIAETAEAVFADFDRVHAVLASTDNRADLSQRLMDAFPHASSNTIKAHIADWSRKLSGNAALGRLTPEVVTEEDLTILDTHFSGARELKRLRNARASLTRSDAH